MADLRTARRTAEQLAATLWAAPCSGPPASWVWPWPGGPRRPAPSPPPRAREIVRAAEAEAAVVVDRARQEAIEADTGYAAAWRAATTAGWAPAQLRGMGYPRPSTPRRRADAPAPAEPVVAAEHSPAAAADG